MDSSKRVAILHSAIEVYPDKTGFSPSMKYSEYRFDDLSDSGDVYQAVRDVLHLQGLDNENYGTKNWNPLKDIVKPGDRVVIKPNLVLDFNSGGHPIDCLVTHASVLRPIIDYALIALNGKGHITVADSPHGNANFEKILELTGLGALQSYYRDRGIVIDVLDLRRYEYGFGQNGFIGHRKQVNRDPQGYAEIDLGNRSAFVDLPHIKNLYGADFDRREICKYHNQKVNKYLVARTFLTADVIIDVPKLKTHKKIGNTLNLKGFIGINGDKNYLPHFRINDPAHGGDEYPNLESRMDGFTRWIKRRAYDFLLGSNRKKVKTFMLAKYLYKAGRNAISGPSKAAISSGDWYGNKTVYRTVYDLSRIIFMADKNGVIRDTPQRRFFSIVDGIIAGEKDGPLEPSPRPCGVVICGHDPVAVDLAATRLMGFDSRKMAVYNQLRFLTPDHPLKNIQENDIEIKSNIPEWQRNFFSSPSRYLGFVPPRGWQSHVEITYTEKPGTAIANTGNPEQITDRNLAATI